MKYCQTCGAELHDLAEICPKCGVRCAVMPTVETAKNTTPAEDKPIKGTGLGVVLTLLLGIIGVLICHFLGDESSKKAAWKTFWICLIIGAVIGVIYGIIIAALL